MNYVSRDFFNPSPTNRASASIFEDHFSTTITANLVRNLSMNETGILGSNTAQIANGRVLGLRIARNRTARICLRRRADRRAQPGLAGAKFWLPNRHGHFLPTTIQKHLPAIFTIHPFLLPFPVSFCCADIKTFVLFKFSAAVGWTVRRNLNLSCSNFHFSAIFIFVEHVCWWQDFLTSFLLRALAKSRIARLRPCTNRFDGFSAGLFQVSKSSILIVHFSVWGCQNLLVMVSCFARNCENLRVTISWRASYRVRQTPL